MRKDKAIELLGGTIVSAAETLGITYQAVRKWPDELPASVADRVLAYLARKNMPGAVEELLNPSRSKQGRKTARAQ